jgi:hypothetical protein
MEFPVCTSNIAVSMGQLAKHWLSRGRLNYSLMFVVLLRNETADAIRRVSQPAEPTAPGSQVRDIV